MHLVTRVVLPGLGSSCPECLARGHVEAQPFAPKEIYTFGIPDPQVQIEWDVDAARELIADRPRSPLRLTRDWLDRWLINRSSLTLQHLTHIPAARLAEPGVLVEIMAGPADHPEPFRILIDGAHRAAKRSRAGQDCWAYLLTEDEQRSICTYRVEGQTTEIPESVGRGVNDREAGILFGCSRERTVA